MTITNHGNGHALLRIQYIVFNCIILVQYPEWSEGQHFSGARKMRSQQVKKMLHCTCRRVHVYSTVMYMYVHCHAHRVTTVTRVPDHKYILLVVVLSTSSSRTCPGLVFVCYYYY